MPSTYSSTWPRAVIQHKSPQSLIHQVSLWVRVMLNQGAYKFWKIKFSEIYRFSRPSKHIFPDTIKYKRDLTNHLISQFSSHLAQKQNIFAKEHGDWLHPCQSLCHPDCYWQLCSQLDVQEIHLISHDIKVAFKSVDKQHMLYCNTVTFWQHCFPK